jgi:hypothetical protein
MRREFLARRRGGLSAYHVWGKSAKDSEGWPWDAGAANNGDWVDRYRSMLLQVEYFWTSVARRESY